MYLNETGPFFGDGVGPNVNRVGVGGSKGDVHVA